MPTRYNPFTGKLDIVDNSGSTGITSVSGTTNRITSTGGATPIIDIAGTYVGQSSITTLGTVTTGVWTGTAIAEANGGTGTGTYTTGDILYSSATNVLSKLPVGSNTEVLTLSGGVPTWAAAAGGGVTSVSGTANRVSSTGGATPIIDIDAAYVGQGSITTLGTITTGVWTGTDVAVSDGGTGLSSTTAYALLCGGTTSTSALQSIASVGTSGQILTSNGAGALPTFQAAAAGGGGDVSGGGTSTDNALVRWNGVSGDTIQDSNYLFDDAPAGYAGSESHSVKDVAQTTDETITDLVQIAIVEDRVLAIESRIAVIQSDHTTYDTFFVQCAFKREAGGNVAIIGTPIVNSMDGSILTITVTADTAAQEGTIQVTGVAATTYNWVSHTNYHFVNTNA